MKKSLVVSLSLAVLGVCRAGLGAQEPRSTKANPSSPNTVTLVGCVDRADQLNASSPSTTADSLSFVLTHADRDGKAAASKPTADTRSAIEAGSIYKLDGAVATLNPHVGHKGQVTGTVEPTAAGTTGTTDPGSAANAPRLHVKSIKMLAETCAR